LSSDAKLGFFTGSSGPFQVMRTTREGFGTPVAVDLQSGAFGAVRAGQRLDVRQYEVRFWSHGVQLAGTLTLPAGPGPFPAAAYVSGSGETLREEAQFLGGYLVGRGVAVLGYDKRGIGQSRGVFPGIIASEEALSIYADDAVAATRFLAAQAEIDKRRVGFYGLSQGGWIMPLAASRAPATVSWALVQGGPTVTQGESDYYGSIAGFWTGPLTEAEAQARANGPSGFDPMPFIRQLTIPMLWLYGRDDRSVPPDTSSSLLRGLLAESPRDFTIHLYDGAPHPLFSRSGFPTGMFADVGAWLDGHRL
jgi:dienelactone hydrolase